MRAGGMWLQVQVDAVSNTRDSAGGIVHGWTTVRTPWTEPKQAGGDERAVADRETATETLELWGHWIDWSDITTTHRVVHDGKHYDIRRVDPISRRGGALIVATLHAGAFVAADGGGNPLQFGLLLSLGFGG